MFKDMKNNPKSKNIKFGVFCNLNVGTLRNAPDIKTAILNLTKREKEFWSHIMWFNDKGQTMQITRCYIEQGMSVDDVIEDWLEHGHLIDNPICVIE